MSTHVTAQSQPQNLPSHPFVVRGGLPNAGRKLKEGGPLTVVFIGGSITRLGGADGYVSKTEEWLRAKAPGADIRVINAGISGTDSNFGAKRFDRDVLVHKPDLVLIEFAVNDGQADNSAHMERMVFKTWMANPETDIAFFYTLSKAHLDDYAAGRLPIAASHHERVAIHHNIPTIGLAHSVAAKLREGKITWEQFANDAVHPNAGGYAHFNEALQAALAELLAAGTPGPHTLRDSLTPNLVVYPPAPETQPLEPKPFVDSEGRRAAWSHSNPLPALHWAGEPVYSDGDGRPLWRLHWINKDKTAAMSPASGMDKRDWGGNRAVWFAEDRSFTGPEGNGIYHPVRDGGALLGFSGSECAVLVFVAPRTGVYRFRVGADRLNAWQNEETEFALNVGYFAWGEDRGTSVAHYRSKRKDVVPFELEREVKMVAGEELAFIPCSDSPGHVRGGWANFQVAVGWMGE